MEEQFQFQPLSLLAGGEAPSATVDEAYYSGVCAGLSFRSLLTSGSLESASEIPQNFLKMPKAEPLFAIDDGVTSVAPPYNFFSEATSSSLHHHQKLPDLLSYEPPHNTVAVESPMINPRSGTASNGKQPRRRQSSKMSDKTRCLEKLLPSGRKMDMATVLEEAHKYIKFLQAQISVLQSMPRESAAANYGGTSSVGVGDLGRLNRQQLLQVVMNSPAAQTQFYSKGCCVYSVEQLLLLKKNAEMEAVRNHMVLDASNPNSFHP